eukprot:CAMPEP_0201586056 /NCGR_PEP_ID=MMETSP0190_2-20130828/128390_1 /ASSEMBLY_ACC=CAM_ASM_000263 /TAXON_ID=37353 /ORGANISM="Rosalina sp." /LENGTH=46 /DNA_ID= /DNA_START= /DNA_END= /DNA_ORIENTATION=
MTVTNGHGANQTTAFQYTKNMTSVASQSADTSANGGRHSPNMSPVP